ncbi:hypothetical protein [Sphingobacterium wenxiniae]|uniref:Uncharacterized protein n=1 Tax=Sphingobacterium wenxiniae TaxID=683125 RepID=A0A1I6VBH3_9SPHI|nr:hypothetical protein [Sphingobacterium wenxiniae]SFT10975.1 hypothetical protein SAMN05660206_11277 [Sphingobacterium wenxiniae]
MNTLDNIKHSLIDRILVTKNEELLQAIEYIFIATEAADQVQLTSEQTEMLLMSEEDITYERIVSEDELEQSDKKWLD